MSLAVLIAICFSLGFFVESIVGFGGGLIAYAALGFFMDIKEMILSGLYIGTCSSFYIATTDRKSFDKEVFKKMVPLSLIGTILGVFFFANFSSKVLSIVFGTLLILLAIKIAIFDKYTFPKIFKHKLVFLGGVSQGSFGIGGPFWVNALRNDFKNKSGLRTTMAIAFTAFNLIRFAQLSIQGQLKPEFFSHIWWTIIPVFLAIQIGYHFHLKISEDFFKKMIGLITLFAGLKFLSKVF